MPTARARYRRRGVMDLLARGTVERSSPGGRVDLALTGSLALVDGVSLLLLVDGASELLFS